MRNDLGTFKGSHLIHVDKERSERLLALATDIGISPYDELERFLLQARLALQQLPHQMVESLLRFRQLGNLEGAILVRGLPIDPELPATPPDSERTVEKTTYVSEFCLCLISAALGEPISYIQEKSGSFFQNVCPTPWNEEKFSTESSRILLPFHTEDAFHPFRPSFVCLSCLRSDHDKTALTLVASIRQLFPLLLPSQKEILAQPLFETGIDYSFGRPNATKGGGPVTPILYGDAEDPYFRFDPDLMKAYTRDGEVLMATLNTMAHDVANYVALEPGDLIAIDNRRAVHARTEFRARYDGKDRWLQRLCVAESLEESAADRCHSERIIRTQFIL